MISSAQAMANKLTAEAAVHLNRFLLKSDWWPDNLPRRRDAKMEPLQRAARIWRLLCDKLHVDQDIYRDNHGIAHGVRALSEKLLEGVIAEIDEERTQQRTAGFQSGYIAAREEAERDAKKLAEEHERRARRALPPLSERLRTRGRR